MGHCFHPGGTRGLFCTQTFIFIDGNHTQVVPAQCPTNTRPCNGPETLLAKIVKVRLIMR